MNIFDTCRPQACDLSYPNLLLFPRTFPLKSFTWNCPRHKLLFLRCLSLLFFVIFFFLFIVLVITFIAPPLG